VSDFYQTKKIGEIFMHMRTIVFVLCCSVSTLSFGADLNQVNKAGLKRNQDGKAAQDKVNVISDKTADIVSEFKSTSKIVDGLKVYNDLLAIQVDNQHKEMASISESIKNVSIIERQIVPLMVRMIDSFEQFIALDVPFLLEERENRVAKLRKLMLRSDVNAAEKFRRVFEAYQIENDYGRTIEAYRGSLPSDGGTREVDFLRVGRIALLYQTVGGDMTGAWDTETHQWHELSASDYKKHVAKGLRIARKQIAPDLLVLPVAAAKGVAE